jgi:hypothetical protein
MKDNFIDVRLCGLPLLDLEWDTPEWVKRRRAIMEERINMQIVMPRPFFSNRPKPKPKTARELRTLEFEVNEGLCVELRDGFSGVRLYDGPVGVNMKCMPGTCNMIRMYTLDTQYPDLDQLGASPKTVKKYLPPIEFTGSKVVVSCDSLMLDVDMFLLKAEETSIETNSIGKLKLQWECE